MTPRILCKIHLVQNSVVQQLSLVQNSAQSMLWEVTGAVHNKFSTFVFLLTLIFAIDVANAISSE